MQPIERTLKPTKKYGYFLFGPRGAGKSTLLSLLYLDTECYKINLLKEEEEDSYRRNPDQLITIAKGLSSQIKYIIIDEIQKIPKLLDIVHLLIENEKIPQFFILTGSSSRKLKLAGANLLAGRVFTYTLYPFSFQELNNIFTLELALNWGLMPKIYSFEEDADKKNFLRAYVFSYLKAEIWQEQLIRKLEPFQKFIEIVGQNCTEEINFSRYANQVGVDDKTIKSYFEILEDTFMGFYLRPYQSSIRKQLTQAPKFYLIDVGIMKAMAGHLSISLQAKTIEYGKYFEAFFIIECYKKINYLQNDYKMNFLRTKSGVEIDLVLTTPLGKEKFIEIKSTSTVEDYHIKSLKNFLQEHDDVQREYYLISCDPIKKIFEDKIHCLNWVQALESELFIT